MQRLDLEAWENSPLLGECRLRPGQVWTDAERGHRVMVGDASSESDVHTLCGGTLADLNIHDPPYQVGIGSAHRIPKSDDYVSFTRRWITNALSHCPPDCHFYLWTGADQRRGFFPLPEVISVLREFPSLQSRSFVTLRGQRGYGTQKNWMAVRQELLYYVTGNPPFSIPYTTIPRKTKGYFKKDSNGTVTSNDERSRSPYIRPGNVWTDIQQVFYRMEENVAGAYAQKPLSAIERIIASAPGCQNVLDLFSHSGTTLLSVERGTCARCLCMDTNPIFAELTIRRLERFRSTGKTGWQTANPFGKDHL